MVTQLYQCIPWHRVELREGSEHWGVQYALPPLFRPVSTTARVACWRREWFSE